MKFSIPSSHGTYALILEAGKPLKIKVGKLGDLEITPGFYVYIGSAFGTGGLKARVGRHLRQHKKCRWHIDYLRKHLKIVDVWYWVSEEKQECQLAGEFTEKSGEIHCSGFGSSDCKCRTHLLYFKEKPQR